MQSLAGKDQHDAGEYLLFLLQQLCDSNGDETQENCECIIHQCFYGDFQTDRQCRKCHISTDQKMSSDLGIQLPLRTPKDSLKKQSDTSAVSTPLTLQACLDAYTTSETMRLYCQTCGQKDQEFVSQCTFKRLPNVLCITLKVRNIPLCI